MTKFNESAVCKKCGCVEIRTHFAKKALVVTRKTTFWLNTTRVFWLERVAGVTTYGTNCR